MMLYQSVQYHAYHATFVQRRSHAAFEASAPARGVVDSSRKNRCTGDMGMQEQPMKE